MILLVTASSLAQLGANHLGVDEFHVYQCYKQSLTQTNDSIIYFLNEIFSSFVLQDAQATCINCVKYMENVLIRKRYPIFSPYEHVLETWLEQ